MKKYCPNCDSEIKNNFLSSNELVSELRTEMINELTDNDAEGYCSNCCSKPIIDANTAYYNLKNQNIELVGYSGVY